MTDIAEKIIDTLAQHLGTLEGVNAVVKRSLNSTDPNMTLGICLDEWSPEDYEMDGLGILRPAATKYFFEIRHMVKADSMEVGERLHRQTAKSVRSMLYGNNDLAVALRALSSNEDGLTERILKWVVAGQRFASNEIDRVFVSMSGTELVVDTESI